jgi:hypothetical protein
MIYDHGLGNHIWEPQRTRKHHIYIYIYMYRWVYIYMHMHVFACLYIYIYIHTHLHTYIYIHTCIYIYTHMLTQYSFLNNHFANSCNVLGFEEHMHVIKLTTISDSESRFPMRWYAGWHESHQQPSPLTYSGATFCNRCSPTYINCHIAYIYIYIYIDIYRFGPKWAPSWAQFGPIWVPLGPNLGPFGPNLCQLGSIWV